MWTKRIAFLVILELLVAVALGTFSRPLNVFGGLDQPVVPIDPGEIGNLVNDLEAAADTADTLADMVTEAVEKGPDNIRKYYPNVIQQLAGQIQGLLNNEILSRLDSLLSQVNRLDLRAPNLSPYAFSMEGVCTDNQGSRERAGQGREAIQGAIRELKEQIQWLSTKNQGLRKARQYVESIKKSIEPLVPLEWRPICSTCGPFFQQWYFLEFEVLGHQGDLGKFLELENAIAKRQEEAKDILKELEDNLEGYKKGEWFIDRFNHDVTIKKVPNPCQPDSDMQDLEKEVQAIFDEETSDDDTAFSEAKRGAGTLLDVRAAVADVGDGGLGEFGQQMASGLSQGLNSVTSSFLSKSPVGSAKRSGYECSQLAEQIESYKQGKAEGYQSLADVSEKGRAELRPPGTGGMGGAISEYIQAMDIGIRENTSEYNKHCR